MYGYCLTVRSALTDDGRPPLIGLQETSWGSLGLPMWPSVMSNTDPLITAAGVSAGIDMALFVAGAIAGSAQAIQLAIEYDPHPPYPAGSWLQASPETIKEALPGLRKDTQRKFGRLGTSHKNAGKAK